jgi:DNA-binding transcriptional LysR family regulator
MVLADMGIAWLSGELIKQELVDHKIVSYAAELGEIELDIVLYYRDEELAAKVGDVIAAMDYLR